MAGWARADEGRHAGDGDPAWHEAWTFDGWAPDATCGCSTALVLWPGRARAWYWAALVRAGQPLLHLADFDLGLPTTLELRSHGLWASHVCEAPFEQWTVANEAYAVALDDPADAIGRAHGTPAAVAFDLEWYASGPPWPLTDASDAAAAGAPADGVHGYGQDGAVHGVIELAAGPLALEGPARRRHWWGHLDPWPAADRDWPPPGLPAPVLLDDGAVAARVLERVLAADGWHEAVRPG